MSSRDKSQTETTPGPVPLPPPNRRSSFSQNPSFSTLFGSNRGSPPRTTPDAASLGRRFSWSYAPPKESSAIDDSDDLVTSPTEETSRTGSEIGRRLSTTATSLREALGFKVEEPTSPKGIKTVPPPCIPLSIYVLCTTISVCLIDYAWRLIVDTFQKNE